MCGKQCLFAFNSSQTLKRVQLVKLAINDAKLVRNLEYIEIGKLIHKYLH